MLEVLFGRIGENQQVIYVNENIGKVAEYRVHHPLEVLPRILEAKWCAWKQEKSKGGDDGGLSNVVGVDGYLMVTLEQVNL